MYLQVSVVSIKMLLLWEEFLELVHIPDVGALNVKSLPGLLCGAFPHFFLSALAKNNPALKQNLLSYTARL